MFTISNLLKRGANYLLMVFLARTLSIEVIGTYSAYINIVGVLLLVTNFGFSEYLLVNSNDSVTQKKHLSIFLQLSLIIFLILFIASLILPLSDWTLAALVLVKIFLETSFYNIFLAYYQVKNKIKILTLTNFISGGLVIAFSFVFYLYSVNIYTYLVAINCIYILINLLLLFNVNFKLESFTKIKEFLKIKFLDLKYYGIAMITVPIYMMAPTVIGSFLLNPEVLAQYQIAFSIANILLLVSVSLLQEDYATFIESKNDIVGLTKKLKKTGIKIILVNLLFFILFAVVGEQLILLVYKNEAYLEAFYPLLILLFSNMIFMFASVAAVVMVILKMQKEKAKYHFEFIGISIFFGFILTYICGIYGLACTYIILYTYSTFRYLWKYNKIYKISISLKNR